MAGEEGNQWVYEAGEEGNGYVKLGRRYMSMCEF